MEKDPLKEVDLIVRDRSKLMIMYFILFSITMLFGGLISAYIVSSTGQYWVHVTPPATLWISNLLIIASSCTLVVSIKAMKSGNISKSRATLFLTMALGIGFAFTQIAGWNSVADNGSGWGTEANDEGLVAYSWNRIDDLIKSDAVYGEDYDVRINNLPLLYNPDSKELYSPNDPLMVKPITSKVIHITNSSGSYLWVLMMIHILHFSFGLMYLFVNIYRVSNGTINPEDTIRLRVLGVYWHFLGGLWLLLFTMLFLL
jgi:heme/copper-type cytochrome/quinol oxidase subunit 3